MELGSEKRQLINEYTQLNHLITTNETAINDALEFVKAIKEVDEVQSMENQREIMELVVAINQKKEQRSAALAALINGCWIGEEGSLMSLLEEASSPPGRKTSVKHEDLATIFAQIEKNAEDMECLEAQMNDQATLLNALPPSVTEVGKALRGKKFRELCDKLAKARKAKEQLEEECQQMFKCFLRSDADVRKLVGKSLS
ncbi:uncharacterized protein IUM83_01370 [Phytophthora cinnamomi]|uniref:uncharacterized protein n=1 Tax=Phytophthora cinnamomi TaxID=4785 RepID=UPI0035596398|nr:hypothetical protein IUM83_01370 [Phytophthora cinnamomi]